MAVLPLSPLARSARQHHHGDSPITVSNSRCPPTFELRLGKRRHMDDSGDEDASTDTGTGDRDRRSSLRGRAPLFKRPRILMPKQHLNTGVPLPVRRGRPPKNRVAVDGLSETSLQPLRDHTSPGVPRSRGGGNSIGVPMRRGPGRPPGSSASARAAAAKKLLEEKKHLASQRAVNTDHHSDGRTRQNAADHSPRQSRSRVSTNDIAPHIDPLSPLRSRMPAKLSEHDNKNDAPAPIHSEPHKPNPAANTQSGSVAASRSEKDKRTLRSQDGGSRSKSELAQYFPNYEGILSQDSKDTEPLTSSTRLYITEQPPSAPPLATQNFVTNTSLTSTARNSPSKWHTPSAPSTPKLAPPSSPTTFTRLNFFESIDFDDARQTQGERSNKNVAYHDAALDNRTRRSKQDPLSDSLYARAHHRAERQEKQLRNIEKERAQHEKVQLERLREGLLGPDWLRVMGISGVVEGERNRWETARAVLVKEVGVLIQKFRRWKEEERRLRKLEKEASVDSDDEDEGTTDSASGVDEDDDDGDTSGTPEEAHSSPATDIEDPAALQLRLEALRAADQKPNGAPQRRNLEAQRASTARSKPGPKPKSDPTQRRKPGPKPGTKYKPRAQSSAGQSVKSVSVSSRPTSSASASVQNASSRPSVSGNGPRGRGPLSTVLPTSDPRSVGLLPHMGPHGSTHATSSGLTALSLHWERPFVSFFEKPHQRAAALDAIERRSGGRRATIWAFGQPVPEIAVQDFSLPGDYLTPEAIRASARSCRARKRGQDD